MDCLWIKQGGGLFPSDPVTADLLAAIGQGQQVRTNAPVKPRHPEFHKMIMAGLSEVVSNTHPRFRDVGHLMSWLKWKSGMVETIALLPDGTSVVEPESISFSAMDQIKFKAVSEQWREIVLEDYGIDLLEERDAAG